MNDPRDSYFFKLQKKDKLQLTDEEFNIYLGYLDKIIEYANDKKTRKHWISLKKEVLELREKHNK